MEVCCGLDGADQRDAPDRDIRVRELSFPFARAAGGEQRTELGARPLAKRSTWLAGPPMFILVATSKT